MAENNPETRDKVLTQFGATVLSLMAEKGVRTQGELIQRLERAGLDVTQPGLSGWLYGRYNVARAFPVALSLALGLSEQEKTRLAWAFAFGQSKPISLEAAAG